MCKPEDRFCCDEAHIYFVCRSSTETSCTACGDPEGGGGDRGPDAPLKNNKNIGFSRNAGPDPLKIAKLPSQHSMLGHHRYATGTPFNGVSLVANDGPLNEGPFIVVLGSSLPSSIKKKVVKVGHPLTKLSGPTHALAHISSNVQNIPLNSSGISPKSISAFCFCMTSCSTRCCKFLNCSISVLVLIHALIIRAIASSNNSFLKERCNTEENSFITECQIMIFRQ